MKMSPDYFAGGSNLNRGCSDGRPTLPELIEVVYSQSGTAFWVNKNFKSKNFKSTELDGSYGAPFTTIQAAVDAIKQSGFVTDMSNPAVILIMPGLYAENVEIDQEDLYISLFGLGEAGAVRILPSSGTAMTVHNATAASLDAYQLSGTYSDLVNIGHAGPAHFTFKNINFFGEGAADAVQLLGVKGDDTANTTNFLSQGGSIDKCIIESATGLSLYAKNLSLALFNNSVFKSGTTIHEASMLIARFSTFEENITLEYDPADPDGWHKLAFFASHFNDCSHTYMFGSPDVTIGVGVTWKPYCCTIGGHLVVESTGAIEGVDVIVGGNLDINGASGDVTIDRVYVAGVLAIEAAKTATLNAPHIAGDVTLTSGAGAVVFNGGEYMGTLSDTGTRLTFNLGTIGT